MAEVDRLVAELIAEDPGFQARSRLFFEREPFEVRHDAAFVDALADAARSVQGRPPRFIGDTPWMDSALLAAAGIETAVFGPGGTGAHADEEWVDVESMIECAQVLAATAASYCA